MNDGEESKPVLLFLLTATLWTFDTHIVTKTLDNPQKYISKILDI